MGQVIKDSMHLQHAKDTQERWHVHIAARAGHAALYERGAVATCDCSCKL